MTDVFTINDLLDILVVETGISRESIDDSPDSTFADFGLDSLAFLQLQAVLEDRYGAELDTEDQHVPLNQLVSVVNGAGSQQVGGA